MPPVRIGIPPQLTLLQRRLDDERSAASAAAARALSVDGGAMSFVRRRVRGTYVVDEWGFDRELFRIASAVASVRWDSVVGGAEHVPVHGPALLVANSRPLTATPFLVAHAVERATGRAVRFAGVPDLAPVGPALRRVGGVLARPDEIEGLLAGGHLVGVWLSGSVRHGERVGRIDPALLAPALRELAPVLPVATLGRYCSRRWRIEIGPPVRRHPMPGPLAEIDLADEARDGVQRLLDEATPPRRWVFGG